MTYFCIICGHYTVSFWLPTMLKAAGVSNTMQIGFYAAIPYMAAIVAMVWWGRRSDRLGERRWHALPGEGGHVDLPVGNAREAAIHQHIHGQIGHVSAETVLSGGGLVRLYQAMCALDGDTPKHQTPAHITDAALGGEPRARAVVEQFCRFLGRVAGNNVLTLGARGGVYIVGGVVPRFAELFLHSGFAASFADKGCMSGYFPGIPVWLVTAEFSGLLGAGVNLQQALDH
mgnify:CR=1 FL=1